MLEFLKRCGLGVLYILAAPFALVFLALFAVFGVFAFVFMLVKSLILFFSGRSVFDDLPEDIEAKRRLGTLIDTRIKKEKEADKTIVEETKDEVQEKPVVSPMEVPSEKSQDSSLNEPEPTNPGGEA